jgi:DNA-binding response OmpR family regulator
VILHQRSTLSFDIDLALPSACGTGRPRQPFPPGIDAAMRHRFAHLELICPHGNGAGQVHCPAGSPPRRLHPVGHSVCLMPVLRHPLDASSVRLLLIEDDPMIGEAVADALRGEGHSVDWAQDGPSGAQALAAGAPYALLLLDLGLPGRDGLQLLADLRGRGDRLPVLVITARDTVGDRIAGLDAGADDYLVKPFDLDELLARVRALSRRAAGRAEPLLTHGRLKLDPAKHVAWLGEQPLPLSAREFALLQALLERPEAVLSRAQLEERLYGWNEPVGSNTVEVHIHNLRRKLGERAIRNVRGVGYTLGDLEPSA